MIIHWPQVVVIAIVALELGFSLANDGRPRGPFSFWNTAFSMSVWLALLVIGGFFGAMK